MADELPTDMMINRCSCFMRRVKMLKSNLLFTNTKLARQATHASSSVIKKISIRLKNSKILRDQGFGGRIVCWKQPHLVCQSSWVIGDKMKVCLEQIQVAVMYILQRWYIKLKAGSVWQGQYKRTPKQNQFCLCFARKLWILVWSAYKIPKESVI